MNIEDMPQTPEQVLEEPVDALQANTLATSINTQATIASNYDHPNELKVEIMRAITVLVALGVTGYISTRSVEFAEQQAGLILSGVIGGYYGLASQRR